VPVTVRVRREVGGVRSEDKPDTLAVHYICLKVTPTVLFDGILEGARRKPARRRTLGISDHAPFHLHFYCYFFDCLTLQTPKKTKRYHMALALEHPRFTHSRTLYILVVHFQLQAFFPLFLASRFFYLDSYVL